MSDKTMNYQLIVRSWTVETKAKNFKCLNIFKIFNK